ncbi:hypothetical protein DFH29DRAFT_1076482 [Suillus ampliporus]|nr:hypothetical protein DFH29DRAFT_1076482 [Suillus ampliporus]
MALPVIIRKVAVLAEVNIEPSSAPFILIGLKDTLDSIPSTSISTPYLEINPLVVRDEGAIHYLNMAAKLDKTTESICGPKWAVARDLTVYETGPAATTTDPEAHPWLRPAPFGRDLTKEEAYIQKLDASTGVSLKLAVLNPTGRVWSMIASGGASVVYSDAIAAAGFTHELGNYNEYSGVPSEGQTFKYAKTIFDVLTRPPPRSYGKILVIGGGIATFPNVTTTFKGIIRTLAMFRSPAEFFDNYRFKANDEPISADDDDDDDDDDAPTTYQQTKAMGDADREGAKRRKSDLTADVCTVFTRDTKAINPSTGKQETGHWCEVCRAKGLARKHCFMTGSVTSLRVHIRRHKDHVKIYQERCGKRAIQPHARALPSLALASFYARIQDTFNVRIRTRT